MFGMGTCMDVGVARRAAVRDDGLGPLFEDDRWDGRELGGPGQAVAGGRQLRACAGNVRHRTEHHSPAALQQTNSSLPKAFEGTRIRVDGRQTGTMSRRNSLCECISAAV